MPRFDTPSILWSTGPRNSAQVKGSATDDISKCPYVAMKLNGAALPAFLGGAVAELSGPLAAQRAQVDETH